MKKDNVTFFLDGAHNIDSMEVQAGAGQGQGVGHECVCTCHWVTVFNLCQACFRWFGEAAKREVETLRCVLHACEHS